MPLLPLLSGPLRHARRTRALGLALLCLAAADGVAWLAAQRLLDDALRGWTQGLAAQGWTVQPGPRRRGGSILTARITLTSPRLFGRIGTPAGGSRTVLWGGDRLTLSLSALHPLSLRLGLEGPQALHLSDPSRPGQDMAVRWQGRDVLGWFPLGMVPAGQSGRAIWSAALLDLQILGPGGQDAAFRLRDVAGHGLWNGAAGPQGSRLALAMTCARIDLPLSWPMPPGLPDARSLRDAGLVVAIPGRADTHTAAAPTTVLVQDARTRWSTLALHAVGRADLPPDGAPVGEATLSVEGVGDTIRTLAQAGSLSPDIGRVAAAIDHWAAIVAGPPGRPDAPALTDRRITLPLRLRAGALFIGAVPVATLSTGGP
ncbi:hypothetical protein AA13595_2840 [Gluconacetobacter johannae DSM 13595]|uniref:DUF2125 domain-containing protein n=1 Tax=Gluconacetobacter johannae TaxID=112140 RepID=A0A7W4J9A1_9PROT|nr:DUF2125 domain-containing protein [Gluconacetobacter johannae]MBB2177065.1 DUF2125 domain-containing protein [Gluconacetobacter johannae]GBQ90195.1 hypothetical protein AA13595_2840 [Gluconacetobacter johannae DSM 13595]